MCARVLRQTYPLCISVLPCRITIDLPYFLVTAQPDVSSLCERCADDSPQDRHVLFNRQNLSAASFAAHRAVYVQEQPQNYLAVSDQIWMP